MTSAKTARISSDLGRGFYTAREAARLLGVPSWKVKRWAAGYHFNSRGDYRESAPLIRREFKPIAGVVELSFLDLVELLVVKKFREHGVSAQMIRIASKAAADLLGTEKPFCVQKLKTDGKRIFAELAKRGTAADIETKSDHRLLVDLGFRQQVFRDVVSPFLKDFEYDLETELAKRWWPAGQRQSVIIDPTINFGQPILAKYGLPTSVVYEQIRAGRKLEDVASWYEIPVESARNAFAFECQLDA